MYYIPPIHVPEEFNRQLFGPGAKEAVEMYKNAVEDKKLIGILMLMGSTDYRINTFKVDGDLETGSCSGYDDAGKELVKVPMKEPIIIREARDEKLDVTRISVS